MTAAICDNFQLILETITDGIVVVDRLGKVLYTNPSAERLFERGPLLGKALGIPVDPGITTPQEVNLIRPSGIGWAELRSAPLEWHGNRAYVIGVRDITENKLNDDRIRQAAAVFESTREGVMMTDARASIIRVNSAFTEITGYSEAEALGKPSNLLRSGRHAPEFYQEMWASLTATGHWQGEIWNRRKTGEIYPELLTISAVTDKTGAVTHYVAVFADISKLRASELQLDFLAHHDPLTQLPNRLSLMSRLEHALDVAAREQSLLALLMLDLDRFKDVNDSFGHLVGDELLKEVAQCLMGCVRGADTTCRLGGDEFTVLLEAIERIEDVELIATKIIGALSKPFRLAHDIVVRIGVSIGISLYPNHGGNPEQLLKHADIALYQAKAEGRGCYKYFSENSIQAADERRDRDACLRNALARDELCLFYQPQVDMATGRIIGAEALLRWHDPVNGFVAPQLLLKSAEQSGLIVEVGNWVLKTACRQGREWLDGGCDSLIISVNISPFQFRRSHIDTIIRATLVETGLPAGLLELELTELALMQQEGEAIIILEHLRALGVRVAIDDFGVGYSSLAFLKLFPLSTLKIDRTFIEDIPEHVMNTEITATIISIANALHLRVLAEGVETEAQLEFLRMHGCDAYQGYLLSPPIPAAQFAQLLQRVNG